VLESTAVSACALCGAETRRLFVKRRWTFVRCAGCGLVSLSPLPTPAEIEAHHEASYRDGRYAAFVAAETVRVAIARHRLAFLRLLAPEGPWLDVGCSTAAFIAELARAGRAAEGLELSEAAVAQGRARGFTVHRGAAETFTPAHRYAAVTAFDVLEHLPDPLAFVRQALTWLVPGGLLALTLPDAASPMARLMGRHWFHYAPPDHVHYFTPATIRGLLERAGADAIAVRRVWKPLTLDYAAAQLAETNPQLGRLMTLLAVIAPRAWRAHPWPVPVGEILVTGRSARS